MIQIDHVAMTVEPAPGPAAGTPERPAPSAAAPDVVADPASRGRLRELVLDVVRDHLRDLERQGLL